MMTIMMMIRMKLMIWMMVMGMLVMMMVMMVMKILAMVILRMMMVMMVIIRMKVTTCNDPTFDGTVISTCTWGCHPSQLLWLPPCSSVCFWPHIWHGPSSHLTSIKSTVDGCEILHHLGWLKPWEKPPINWGLGVGFPSTVYSTWDDDPQLTEAVHQARDEKRGKP